MGAILGLIVLDSFNSVNKPESGSARPKQETQETLDIHFFMLEAGGLLDNVKMAHKATWNMIEITFVSQGRLFSCAATLYTGYESLLLM